MACYTVTDNNINKGGKEKRLQFLAAFAITGSPAWTRTRDPMINSHVL